MTVVYAPGPSFIGFGVAGANADCIPVEIGPAGDIFVILQDGRVTRREGLAMYARDSQHFRTGTCVETCVDLVRNTVSFTIDGKAYGEAFGPIPNLATFFPFVVLQEAHTRIHFHQSSTP
jgi:hypothetical protein